MVHFKNDVKSSNKDGKNLVKHMVLTTILSYKKKYGKKYGDIILALDNRKYWRRDYFPYYKGKRKEQREKSSLDWDFIFEALDEMKKDLRENFPYKMIDVGGAEADDVIACITKYLQENELSSSGLIEEPQPILIISSDTDHAQLQKYGNVDQYSSIQKKWVKPEKPIKDYIIEHICTGDTGDGVPNICSNDNCLVEGIRQKPFKKSRLEDFNIKGIDACIDDNERRNFQRNQMLVDYDYIPKDINDKIIESYISQEVVKSKGRVLNYLMKNGMRLLIDSANDF